MIEMADDACRRWYLRFVMMSLIQRLPQSHAVVTEVYVADDCHMMQVRLSLRMTHAA